MHKGNTTDNNEIPSDQSPQISDTHDSKENHSSNTDSSTNEDDIPF